MTAAAQPAAPAGIRRPACLPEGRPWPPRSVGTAATPQDIAHDTQPSADGKVRVTGVLLADAELRHPPGGADAPSELHLHLSTGQGAAYIARQRVPNEPLPQRAAAIKARSLLRRGESVTVTARGMKPAHSEFGSAVLLLTDVLDVSPHAVASPIRSTESD